MKHISLLFFVLFLMTSCEPYRRYQPSEYSHSQDQTQLTQLPIHHNDEDIEVFFANEKPKKPYVKAFLLEEVSYREISYAELVNQLKRQAKEKGADALIILSRNRSISETEISYTVTNMASALGIKYVKNIPFQEGMPKEMSLSLFDTEKAIYVEKEVIPVTPNNLPVQPRNHILYMSNFYYYSLDCMLYEKNRNWSYIYDEINQRVTQRKYGPINPTFTFFYDQKDRVTSVLKDTEMYELEIKFFYENDLLVKKETYQKRSPRVKPAHKRTEIFEYGANDLLLRRTIFKIDPITGEQNPYVKLSYEFYTEKEYKELLAKETQQD